ncbi:MAG TPA: hypothetical protein VNN55_09880 [bacterium]|nr:hypothetical protein [bacterium]
MLHVISYRGPYTLTLKAVEWLRDESWPGVFVLGESSRESGSFHVEYVGRSDTNLADRISEWIGTHPEFMFAFTETPWQAFLEECHIFHHLHPSGNQSHPVASLYRGWQCPDCSDRIWA